MDFEGKPLRELRETDLHTLVKDQVRESIALDFKLKYDSPNLKGQNEVLKDITAMANAQGGRIFIGIRDEKDVAAEIVGIPDAEVWEKQINGWCKVWIDPKIAGLEIFLISLAKGGHVIAIGIPESRNKPHLVKYSSVENPTYRCYRRSSTNNYEIGIREIKDIVLYEESAMERADEYFKRRQDGLRKQMTPESHLVYSIIPTHFASNRFAFNDEEVAILFGDGSTVKEGQIAEFTPKLLLDGIGDGELTTPRVHKFIGVNGYIEVVINYDANVNFQYSERLMAYTKTSIPMILKTGANLLKRMVARFGSYGPYKSCLWATQSDKLAFYFIKPEYIIDGPSGWSMNYPWGTYQYKGGEFMVPDTIKSTDVEIDDMIRPTLLKFGRAFGIEDLPGILVRMKK
ncbi:MAG: ATP-binding protein [candidate division Zixibacteria bacterium]|nr:ATP-binding protein [candidate division Zixibacteria bacterium]